MNIDQTDITAELVKWLKTIESFTAEQAPLMVDEIIYWGKVQSSIGFSLGLLLIVMGCLCIKPFIKTMEEGIPEIGIPSALGMTVGFTVGSLVFAVNLMSLIQIFAAPRLYVLDSLKGLL